MQSPLDSLLVALDQRLKQEPKPLDQIDPAKLTLKQLEDLVYGRCEELRFRHLNDTLTADERLELSDICKAIADVHAGSRTVDVKGDGPPPIVHWAILFAESRSPPPADLR